MEKLVVCLFNAHRRSDSLQFVYQDKICFFLRAIFLIKIFSDEKYQTI